MICKTFKKWKNPSPPIVSTTETICNFLRAYIHVYFMTQYKHISGLVWPIKISVVQVTGRGCILPGCIQWGPRTPFTDLSERGELANRHHTQCQAEWTHYWPYSWCATSSRLWFQSVSQGHLGWLTCLPRSKIWGATSHLPQSALSGLFKRICCF